MKTELIKVKAAGDGRDVIVPKARIATIKALEGTDTAEPQDVQPDAWAKHTPELA